MFSNYFLMKDNNIIITNPTNLEIDCIKLQKMAFIYNAVQSGWEVKMNDDKYIFTAPKPSNYKFESGEVYFDKGIKKLVKMVNGEFIILVCDMCDAEARDLCVCNPELP